MPTNSVVKYKKIQDTINNEEPLRSVLRYIVALIGININKLDPLEVNVIINFLQNNFLSLKLDDLKEAFDMGVMGKLDIDLTHYQSFNTLYISNVILSYKRVTAKNRMIKPMKIESKPPPALTLNEIKAHTEIIKNKFKNNEPLDDAKWTDIYQHLKTQGLIEMTNKQIKDFQDKVMRDLTNERQIRRENKKGTIDLDFKIDSKMIFYCECRKRVVLNYFDND